jgi:small-conductance mechanosensitive channel
MSRKPRRFPRPLAADSESEARMSALQSRHAWFFLIFLFCAAIGIANLAHFLLFRFTRLKQAERGGVRLAMRKHLSKPARVISILVCVMAALPFVPVISHRLRHFTGHALAMAVVASLGWFAGGSVYVFEALILRKYDITATDNVQARKVHTQFQIIRRLAIGFVAIITLAALLWTFNDPRIWQYGTGLLASAGLASLILATAAKSTASNMLAGIQIAFTGMIRIDDVVVVQGDLGRVEEITTAYVVLRIWDLRRMIVPLSYFIENPFYNWTREGSEIMATAFVYMDYTIPVEEVRAQVQAIVEPSEFWDRKVCKVHVTNLTDRAVEMRCLISAANSGNSFELCCLIRERITAWIREHYPEAFPTTRFRMLPETPLNQNDEAAREPARRGLTPST